LKGNKIKNNHWEGKIEKRETDKNAVERFI
jgi:hypothetical protein